MAESDTVDDSEVEGVSLGDADREVLDVKLALGVSLTDAGGLLGTGVEEMGGVLVGVLEGLLLTGSDSDTVTEMVGVEVAVRLSVVDAVIEAVTVAEPVLDSVLDPVPVTDRVCVGVPVTDAVTVGLGEGDQTLGVTVLEGDRVPDIVRVGV